VLRLGYSLAVGTLGIIDDVHAITSTALGPAAMLIVLPRPTEYYLRIALLVSLMLVMIA
jgi:hypothetical protein